MKDFFQKVIGAGLGLLVAATIGICGDAGNLDFLWLILEIAGSFALLLSPIIVPIWILYRLAKWARNRPAVYRPEPPPPLVSKKESVEERVKEYEAAVAALEKADLPEDEKKIAKQHLADTLLRQIDVGS